MSRHTTNTALITGGGSGIGMGLAEALHARGDTVIVAGRSRPSIEAVAGRCPGMAIEELDVADVASITACVDRITVSHPGLNMFINNAGIQRLIDFADGTPPSAETISEEIDINLKGLILILSAFLPLLRQQKAARLIHMGSGLGYVPLVKAPIYSATKAAVHSFSISLRRQLAGTSVQAIEIIPPIVETGLHRSQASKPSGAMTLETFVKDVMKGLDSGKTEIPVGLAGVLRIGSRINFNLFLNVVNRQR